MRLSLHQKNAMKFLQIALMRMNVSERLNLYDPITDAILRLKPFVVCFLSRFYNFSINKYTPYLFVPIFQYQSLKNMI